MNNNVLKKDLNFFAVVGRERGLGAIDFEKSIKKSLMVFVPIFVVALIIVVGGNAVKKNKISTLNREIEAMQDELDKAAERLATKEQLQADIDNFDKAKENYDETPTLNIDMISKVSKARPSTVTTKSFQYSGLTISMSCDGADFNAIASYAHNLRRVKDGDGVASEDAFAGVDYSGTTSGSVTVQLKEQTVEETTEEAPAEEASEAQ
jgi:outer membrane murein-binding lipoprotein Lpp